MTDIPPTSTPTERDPPYDAVGKGKPRRSGVIHKTSEGEVINSKMTSAYESHQENLTKRALYKTSDADLSADLVQSTFLKTLLYLQKGGKVEIMRAFLNHILNDLIVDEYRKRKTVSLDALLEQGFDPCVDYTEQLINMLDGKKMILLIDRLPKKYRLIIKMRYVQGLSLREIAALTRQTPNTVSVQSYRGLRKLAALQTSGRAQLT
jgi:RNA polymerase sigma-70 factor (ECF subfamily)